MVLVEGDGLPDQVLERGAVDLILGPKVDRSTDVSRQSRVEQMAGVREEGALGKGQLDDLLVGLTCTNDSVVRPNRRSPPFPFFEDGRGGLVDEPSDEGELLAAPVAQLPDPCRDELGSGPCPSLESDRMDHWGTRAFPTSTARFRTTRSYGGRRLRCDPKAKHGWRPRQQIPGIRGPLPGRVRANAVTPSHAPARTPVHAPAIAHPVSHRAQPPPPPPGRARCRRSRPARRRPGRRWRGRRPGAPSRR